jgi:hypothetical protein
MTSLTECAANLRQIQARDRDEVLDLIRDGIKHASRAGTIGGQQWAERARDYLAAQMRQEGK